MREKWKAQQEEKKKYEQEIGDRINTIEDDKWRLLLTIVHDMRITLFKIQSDLDDMKLDLTLLLNK